MTVNNYHTHPLYCHGALFDAAHPRYVVAVKGALEHLSDFHRAEQLLYGYKAYERLMEGTAVSSIPAK